MGHTIDGLVGSSEVGIPAHCDVLAVECVDGEDVEWNGRLSTLTGFKSSLAREGRAAERQTLEGQNGVGVIGEVGGQKCLGLSGGIGNNEALEAGGQIVGRCCGQALGRIRSPETSMAPRRRDGGGGSEEGGARSDGGSAHVDGLLDDELVKRL